MDNWDNRFMFEQLIYDYLVKKEMHHAAEVFRTEASLIPNIPPAMDVPEGFLFEWWSTMYDFEFFRQFVQVRAHKRQRLETMEGGNAFQGGQRPLNTNAEDQLPNHFTSASNGGGSSNSMASHVSGETPQLVIDIGDELSKIFLPYSNREELLRPTSRRNNIVDTTNEKVESSVEKASTKAENTASNECSKNMNDLLGCVEGSTRMNAFSGITAPTLQDDNECETSNCPSNFQTVSTGADASMVNQLDSSKQR